MGLRSHGFSSRGRSRRTFDVDWQSAGHASSAPPFARAAFERKLALAPSRAGKLLPAGQEPARRSSSPGNDLPGARWVARPNPAPSVGGNHGTTVEYITFKVKDLKGSLAKWSEAGIVAKSEKGAATIVGPDDVQVRITEDKNLAAPIASDGLVMNVANAAEVSAWYAKWFGAKIGQSGGETIGEIPGARIVFHVTKDPIAPMRGHSFGLLGFEVKDLQEFVKKYQEAGGKFDGNGNIATATAANLSVIQLTDPWGTSIEVSQGLKAVK